jgi:hypothetical protein
MPLQLFIVLIYGICCWLAIAIIEPLMRSFAAEAGIASWLFVAIPGLLAMLFALFAYRGAATRVQKLEHSVSRGLLVTLLTWIAVALLIAWLWCPAAGALSCSSNVLMATGIIGGGPLLVGALVAAGIVGVVLRRRPGWISFQRAPRPTPPAAGGVDAG